MINLLFCHFISKLFRSWKHTLGGNIPTNQHALFGLWIMTMGCNKAINYCLLLCSIYCLVPINGEQKTIKPIFLIMYLPNFCYFGNKEWNNVPVWYFGETIDLTSKGVLKICTCHFKTFFTHNVVVVVFWVFKVFCWKVAHLDFTFCRNFCLSFHDNCATFQKTD